MIYKGPISVPDKRANGSVASRSEAAGRVNKEITSSRNPSVSYFW